MTKLHLGDNGIIDVSPLSGLTQLELLFLRDNPLSEEALGNQIPALEAQGVMVLYED